MTEPEAPAKYSIEKLLSGPRAQPWKDMPPEKFEAFKADIKARGQLKPIDLTVEQFVFNGHQRLRALLALGRKQISAKDVQIHPNVNANNMMDYAIAINDQSRDITGADRAAVMHERVRDGWSQRRIAKAFAVSQAAVSKLMAKYPPDEDYVAIVSSEDGSRTYTRTPARPETADKTDPAPLLPPPKPRPFEPDGKVSLVLHAARAALKNNTPVDLTPWTVMTFRDLCRDLIKDVQNFVDDYLPETEA
jgi:hypothetical protein